MNDLVLAGILAGAIAGAIIGASVIVASLIITRRRSPMETVGWRGGTRVYRQEHAYGSDVSGSRSAGAPLGPFDRFNDRAKRVLALAQDEAIRLNHNYIGTEHLLLGLVREGEGVAALVLDSLGVELSKVRTAVERIIGRGESTASPSEITLSPRTKKVIELAIDEARKLGHSHVGTEHLLLALVREGEGIASGILESLGVTLEKVRQQVIATLGQPHPKPPAPTPPPPTTASATGTSTESSGQGPFDRFDSNAKRTLALAQDEAIRFGHNWIGTEHLMLGLVRGERYAHDALTSLGVELAAARAAVEAVVPRGTAEGPGEITLAPRTKAVIDRAIAISRERNNAPISPVLLLLALVADASGVGTQVLIQLGATPEKIRAALEPPPSNPSA
jgi:ATP-dependent Clp protease ATP-binding subunit ClpA